MEHLHLIERNDLEKTIIYAKVWNNQGEKYVDIRKFYKFENADTHKPTRRGVCFKRPQWKEFQTNTETISTAIDTRKRIGDEDMKLKDSNIFITVKQWKGDRTFIGIKKRDPQETPEVLGVTLSPQGWQVLLSTIPLLNEELEDTE